MWSHRSANSYYATSLELHLIVWSRVDILKISLSLKTTLQSEATALGPGLDTLGIVDQNR